MGIKKNAGKIQQPKKQVKATFAECKAKNPLECKYHGFGYLDKQILPNAMKDSNGNPIPYVCDKDGNKYEIRIGAEHDWHPPVDKLNGMLWKQGWNVLVDHDKMDGKNCYKLTLTKGDEFQFLTPADEADLSYESEEAPVDGDDVVGSPDDAPEVEPYNSGVTNEDIKDFLVKNGYTKAEVNKYSDKGLGQWHNVIGTGFGMSGEPIGELAIDSLKEMMSVAGKNHPVSKVLAKTIAKLEGKPISEDQPKKVDKPKVETEKKEENVEPKEDDGEVTKEDIKDGSLTIQDLQDFLKKSGHKMDDSDAGSFLSIIQTGKYGDGSDVPEELIEDINLGIKDANLPNHKVTKVWEKTKAKLNETNNKEAQGNGRDADQKKSGTGDGVGYIDPNSVDLNSLLKRENKQETTESGESADNIDLSEFDNDEDVIGGLVGDKEIIADFSDELEEGADEFLQGEEDEITPEDIKDFFKKCGIKKDSLLSDANLAATKEALETGKWNGKDLTKGNKSWYESLAKKAPDHKVAKAIKEMLSSDKLKPQKTSVGVSAKSALLSAMGNVSGTLKFNALPISKDMLKPLKHDEAKFPIEVTKEMLDKRLSSENYANSLEEALTQKKSYPLGGASGDKATLIHIDNKPYVVKAGSGSHAEHIHNEVLADQAYRAGGIRVPDCKEYVFDEEGDKTSSKTYKLAEFIKGKSLSSYMASATESQRDAVRKDLLAGFPMDVLFSNWDVIGTSRDNVLVDEDGHAWRIDNGGSFDMAAQSNKKTMAWAVKNYIKIPEEKGDRPLAAFENWDEEGGWTHRQWIDDFRTMRIDPKNKGVFDHYSTSDIFLSAANIDFGNAVSGLPQELKNALSKPLFEMRAMSHQAWCAKEAGYGKTRSMVWKDANGVEHTTPVDTMSVALDAIYEAHKDGCREWLQKKTTWGNLGWLSLNNKGSGYQKKVFPEDAPPEPLPPPIGMDFTAPILTAIKSINYHIKQGDYVPNKTSLKKALELKPVLEVLESDGVDKAKGLMEAIQKIEDAANDGYKTPLTFNTANGMFDVQGLSLKFDSGHESIVNKHLAPKHDEWKHNMEEYLAKKEKWDKDEEKKAKAAGAAPESSFGAYEDKLIEANIDTSGVPRGGGKPQCNHESKESQKHSSFLTDSCKKKVRQYAMMGIPLDEMYFKNGDKVFYNGNTNNGGYHVSGHNTSEADYYAAIDFYRQNPDIFKADMESYARHKGMMALVHMNIENDGINAKDGTVFVMREEHVEAWGKNGVGHPTGKSRVIDRYPIDSSTSAQINGTGIYGDIKVGWKLPIWRVTDNFMIESGNVGSGGDGEMEICINPIQIPYPPMYFSKEDGKKGWKHCMDLYLAQPEIKGALPS